MLAHRRDQDRLQIAAMDDPIGRAVAANRVIAQWHARERMTTRGLDLDRGRRDRVRLQPRLEPERRKNRHGIGRELDASAGFLQPRRLFEQGDAESTFGERKAGGQSADPGPGHDDIARGRHRPRSEPLRPARSARSPADGPHADRAWDRDDRASSNRGR